MLPKLQDELKSLARFADRYSLGRDRGEGSDNFLRIKVARGRLTLEQFRGIVHLSKKFGRGYLEVTDRQDIQLHWIRQEDAPEIFGFMEKLGLTTDKCGQGVPVARYGDVRNVVTCPVAGIDRDEIFDVSPDVEGLNRFFIGNTDFQDLPRKFKISVSACPKNCASAQVQDVGYTAMRLEGREGYALHVGGGIGVSPMLAKSLQAFLGRDLLLDVTVAMAEIFRDLGRRDSKAKARFKWLVQDLGLDRLRLEVEERVGAKLEDIPPGSLPSSNNSCEHYGVQEQKQRGYFYVCIPLIGGVLGSEKAEELAQIADRYGVGEIRLTNFQNIILPHVDGKFIDEVVDSVERIGLDPFGSVIRFCSIACAGNFCGKAPENPKVRLKDVLEHIEATRGEELQDVELRLSVSGCPNGCARHMVSDIGLQGVHAKDKEGSGSCYDMYVGGSIGADGRLATLLAKAVPAAEVKVVVDRIAASFLSLKDKYASFADFCASKGVDELRRMAGLGE